MKDKAKPSITRNSCFICPSAHHSWSCCYMVLWSLRKLLGIHLYAGIVYTCFWTTWIFLCWKSSKQVDYVFNSFFMLAEKNQSSTILALWGESTSVQWIPLTKVQYAEMQKVIFLDVSLTKIQISSTYFLLPQKQGAVAKWLFQA